MERYFVQLDRLNEKNVTLKNTIEYIKECIVKINELKENVHWTGQTKEKFFVRYDEYIEELKNMVANLELYLKVTKKYQDNFTNGYQEIKSGFKKIVDEVERDGKQKSNIFIKQYDEIKKRI